MAEMTMGKMMLLPPADGKCRICAVDHGPTLPHNYQSLFYQVRFRARYGRDGTWADAIAHCPAAEQEFIKDWLVAKGHWTEPADGKVIAEPIDG